MRFGDEPVGRWGLALLAATGVAGLVLAMHGWSVRGSGLAPGSVAVTPQPAPDTRAPQASASSSHPGPSPSARPSPSPSPSASASVGPLLSSEPYSSSSFQIWPGRPTAAARAALTGLKVSVHRHGTGLSVAASVIGQPPSASHLYPAGARVYIVETSLGDDSGNTDYSLGDDGLVVTSADGRIVQ